MAQDVARYIYKIAKEDVDSDVEYLQQFYKKRVADSKHEVRRALFLLVKDHMKTTLQQTALNTKIILPDRLSGALPSIKSNMDEPQNEDKIYYLKKTESGSNRVLIMNEESRFLIKYAILPLNLKWGLTWNSCYYIHVSWDHWPQ